jgi:hypothetical protein
VIIAVCGLMGVVFTAIGGVIVAVFNSRNKHGRDFSGTTAEEDWAVIRERVAVLEQRVEDYDETTDVQDRRFDQIERALELDNPNWRQLGSGGHHLRRRR